MKRTTIAQQGLDFATLFAAKFSGMNVSGFAPLMREPPADSTGGGKQALQHLVLYPKREGEPMVTFGSVNVATRTARLRTRGCLEKMHALRFGNERPFPVDPRQYQALFDRLLAFMKAEGLQVEIETSPPQELASVRPPPPPPTHEVLGSWIVLLMLMVVAALLTYLAVSRLVGP